MKFFQREADSAIRTGAMLLGGLGLGAALMYVLDPERGKRRRGIVRDKAVSAARKASDRLDARSRDLRNRARGVASELKAKTRSEAVSDPVLEERVRAEIGHVVSSPGAIEIAAFEGVVTLSGAVLAREVDDLLSATRGVRGVEEVENRLQVYETPEAVPALQKRDRWEAAESET
jgi:osmotically-inducible protein OsmY